MLPMATACGIAELTQAQELRWIPVQQQLTIRRPLLLRWWLCSPLLQAQLAFLLSAGLNAMQEGASLPISDLST